MSDIRRLKMAEAGLEMGGLLSQKLWSDLRGDAIGTTIYYLGDGFRRNAKIYSDEGIFHAGPYLYKALYDKMVKIKNVLGIEDEVDLFIAKDSSFYATSGVWYEGVEHRDIILSSGLVEHFSDDEICFVIGHELGHFVRDNLKLKVLVRHIYKKEEPNPYALNNRLRLSSELIELFCDRCGCIAAGSLEPCVSAMFQIVYGSELSRFGDDVNSYIVKSEDKVKEMQTMPRCFNRERHPNTDLRIVSLKLFAESKNITSLRKSTLPLVKLLCDAATQEAYDEEVQFIVAFAKMIEVKANLVPGTYREPVTEYLKNYRVMTDEYYDSIKPEDVETTFAEFLNNHRDRVHCSVYKVVPAVCNIAYYNRIPSAEELSFIKSVAVDVAEIDCPQVEHYFAHALRNHYKPE